MFIFGVTSFVSFLLAFILFFLPSPVFLFSLPSSARLPPLAFTGGYSSLGWAEAASLSNTDRLLGNQIPSVATSEDSLSRFLRQTQTHTQAHNHICASYKMCVFYVQRPMYLQSFHLIYFWPAGRKSPESISPLSIFPSLPLRVQRSLSSGIHVCSACQQDLGCCITQEIVDFSSSVLDQRPTISKAASLSQCLPNACPRSGTQNVDTVPKVLLQVPPPSVIAQSGSRTFSI